MSCFLRYFELFGECGDSRGMSGLFCLSECNDSVESHLASLHLSRDHGLSTERDLILAQAGMFEIDNASIATMKICAKHRHNLGKFWRPSTACVYPTHKSGSRKKSSKSRYSINLEMSKIIQQMFGILRPVGSGESKNWYIYNATKRWYAVICTCF